MKSSIFIISILVSGAFSGLIYGGINLFVVEPFLDEAIGLENQHLFESGKAEDTPQFWIEYEGYRTWQKGGQIFASVILGIVFGSLFGIIFSLSKDSLPGNSFMKKSLILSGILWATIFLIPFLKYPSNPPTVGEEETIVVRTTLYLMFIGISGFGALGFYKISKKLYKNKRWFALLGFGSFIASIFILMPENPDKIFAPMELVNNFRIASALSLTCFWIILGFIHGLFLQKIDKKQ